MGVKKENVLKRNFYTSSAGLQSLLEQYYGYNWNALSKLWKGDYRLVAFEFIPIYLSIIARLEHACNGRINTNYYKSNENMRAETTTRLDDIDIHPQLGSLISTLEKLQTLFHDLGVEMVVFPFRAYNTILRCKFPTGV